MLGFQRSLQRRSGRSLCDAVPPARSSKLRCVQGPGLCCSLMLRELQALGEKLAPLLRRDPELLDLVKRSPAQDLVVLVSNDSFKGSCVALATLCFVFLGHMLMKSE